MSSLEAETVIVGGGPAGITTARVIGDVTAYLEANPARLHDLAAYLVILALRDNYPCRKEEASR